MTRYRCADCNITPEEMRVRVEDCDDCSGGVKHVHHTECWEGGEHRWVVIPPYVDDGVREPF